MSTTTPEERSEDLAATFWTARTAPQIYADYQAFDLSDLGAAIDAVCARGQPGNVLLNFYPEP